MCQSQSLNSSQPPFSIDIPTFILYKKHLIIVKTISNTA